ncbi:hypothetical protein [uncultured Thiohalocapsa sp.]|uniref:hypothetical protein n=1 Tax=uncultured Thiohalocapsa sp. TaxID=768990 RepID=UPI0025E0A75E|nr:hypothetical protein [uncultured Thiohalocapsa sp.]
MGKNRRHLVAVACVLLLNLQLFAANALGCVHQAQADGAQANEAQANGAAPTTAACPHLTGFLSQATSGHAASVTPAGSDTPDGVTAEPCQKCNLGKVAGGWHLVTAQVPEVARSERLVPHARLVSRLTTPNPDGLLRPPRHFSG